MRLATTTGKGSIDMITTRQQGFSNTSGLGKLLVGSLLGLLLLALLARFAIFAPTQPAVASLEVLVAGLEDSFGYMLSETEVQDRSHALKKHGADASAIRKCLNLDGPDEVWKFMGWRKANYYIQTCQLGDDRWGLRIIQLTRNGWIEKTSFIVKDGTFTQLTEYITARAVEFLGDLTSLVL